MSVHGSHAALARIAELEAEVARLREENERHRREEAATERDAGLLQAILASAPEGIVVTDREGRVILTNPAADRLYVRPVPYGQEYSSHAQLEICYPDGRTVPPGDLPLTRAALDGETTRDMELAIRWPDGQCRSLLVNTAPIRNAAAELDGAVGVFQDITQRRQAREALRESERRLRELNATLEERVDERTAQLYALAEERAVAEERFRVTLATSQTTVATLDREQRYTWIYNPHPLFDPQAVLGKRDDELVPPEDVAEFTAFKQSVLDSGVGARREVSVRLPDGVHYYALTVEPLRDAEGRVVGLTTAAADITESKRVEQSLREANAQLADRGALLRTLAAELAYAEERERRWLADLLHDDLQQTLAAAVFHLDYARERAPSADHAALLQAPMAMLREAIGTSRDLSAELSPALLRDTRLAGMLQTLAHRIGEQLGLRVIVEDREPEGIPPLLDDIRLLLYRCVRELLFNVTKHAQVMVATVHVDRSAPERVEVTVSDDGQGFDPSEVQQRGTSEGGLGLFTISERLAYLGGEVRIDSAPGSGARVTLVVPVNHVSAEDEQVSAASEVGEGTAADGRIRILLAEDHAIVRNALCSLLAGQPDMVVVGEAGDGREAMERARALRPDVVLMDVAMPRMDGIEATRRIIAELPKVRVIGLSMYDDDESRDRMHQAGAEAYVPKGGAPDALLAAIRRPRR